LVNFINKEVHDAHPPQIIIRAAFTARRMSWAELDLLIGEMRNALKELAREHELQKLQSNHRNQGMRTLSPLAEWAHALIVPVHSGLFQTVAFVICQCLVLCFVWLFKPFLVFMTAKKLNCQENFKIKCLEMFIYNYIY
jgi:hypothetical protein